jgi:hypothetical protein
MLAALPHPIQIIELLRRYGSTCASADNASKVDNRIKRRAQFVRHVRQKFAFDLTGMLGCGALGRQAHIFAHGDNLANHDNHRQSQRADDQVAERSRPVFE